MSVRVRVLSGFSEKDGPVFVQCPDFCLDFEELNCPVVFCPVSGFLEKNCLVSGRTETEQSCPDFKCPYPPTSGTDPSIIIDKRSPLYTA